MRGVERVEQAPAVVGVGDAEMPVGPSRALTSIKPTERHGIATGDGAHGIALSADARTAYVTNQWRAPSPSSTSGPRTVVRTLTVGTKPNGLVFRPARWQ
jgi:DNA-binding beta-propeller fold protein YncE